MRRTIKKEINLNSLSTGCSPCKNKAKKMELLISDKDITQLKIDEIKEIVSTIFVKDIK
tara:strand:- start:148 stop:324 length:177 start_codon:yes stop_codon:yes gene_type:complete